MTDASPDPARLADDIGESRWDVVVIGSGPAGALAARELARTGARTLLVDRGAFPRDKVCGACLNGHALDALRASGLGRLPEALGGIPLESFKLGHTGKSVRLPLPGGIAVSRRRLDEALASAAVDAGARFLPETWAAVAGSEARSEKSSRSPSRSITLTRNGEDCTVESKIVVVASGLGTTCLEADGSFRSRVSADSRVGVGCGVEDFPDFYQPGTIFMAVGRAGYVGLVRIEDGTLNVAAAFDKPFLSRCGSPGRAVSAVLTEAGFPEIAALGRGASWKGTIPLTRRTVPLAGDRVFLIGDACGYVEPFTGEGMGWALMTAREFVPLVRSGIDHWEPSLARAWESIYHRRIGRRQRVCRGLASLLRKPWLARGAFSIATQAPSAARLIIDRMYPQAHLSP